MNYKAKLDRVFSIWIRKRDTKGGIGFCISCGKPTTFEKGDCGHYINRKHMATRYDEMNCNLQCIKCNRFDEGNIQGYRKGLIKKYGLEAVELLELRKFNTAHYNDLIYKELIKKYTIKK
jgi:hypothetical protein